MLAISSTFATAFATPMSFAQPMRAPMVRMNADADVVEPAASAAVDTATVKGVVVPTGAEAPKLKPHEWNPKGLDVEMRNKVGWTALHAAASGGAERCLVLLLSNGASVDARCRAGRTPLIEAARSVREK